MPHACSPIRPSTNSPVSKSGALCGLPNGRNLPAVGVLSRLPDGEYRLGFRADAVSIGDTQSSSLSFPGHVAVTEISGSESFVHVDVGLGVWVCLAAGVHGWEPGDAVEVRVDANRVFVFDAAGKLAVAPTIAKTA